MVEVELVQGESEIGAVWGEIILHNLCGNILRVTRGKENEKTMYESILKGNYLLYTMRLNSKLVGFVVIDLVQWPTGKKSAFVVYLAGTDFTLWKDSLNEIHKHIWFISGIDEVELLARDGWKRAYPELPFKPVLTPYLWGNEIKPLEE